MGGRRLARWCAKGFGQTETGPVLAFNPRHGERKAGSVGIAVPGTEIGIVDVATGPAERLPERRSRGR